MTGEHVLGVVGHLLSLSANNSTRILDNFIYPDISPLLRWAGLNSQDLARFVPRTPCWRLQHLPPQLRVGGHSARHRCDRRNGGFRRAGPGAFASARHDRSPEQRDTDARTPGYPLAQAEVLCGGPRGSATGPCRFWTKPERRSRSMSCMPGLEVRQFVRVPVAVRRRHARSNSPASISRIVRSRLERSGVKLSGAAGAHLLRHSLATQLVGQRRPINEVADLTGPSEHRYHRLLISSEI